MRIRMLKPFRALKVGVILDQADGVAEMWINCGRAERMVPEATLGIRQRRSRRGKVTTA